MVIYGLRFLARSVGSMDAKSLWWGPCMVIKFLTGIVGAMGVKSQSQV